MINLNDQLCTVRASNKSEGTSTIIEPRVLYVGGALKASSLTVNKVNEQRPITWLADESHRAIVLLFQGLCREIAPKGLCQRALPKEVLKAPDSPQCDSQSGSGRGHAVNVNFKFSSDFTCIYLGVALIVVGVSGVMFFSVVVQ